MNRLLQSSLQSSLFLALSGLLHRWGQRLRQLDDKIEALEFAIALAGGYMAWWFGTCPDRHTGSQMADALFALTPRGVWVAGLWLICLTGLFGYLNDRVWMRRLSSLMSFLFWFCTGTFLLRVFPAYYTPGLHMIIGFFSSWVWTRIAEMEIQRVHRQGQEPARWWWLTGRR